MDGVEDARPSREREFFSHLLSTEHSLGPPQDPRERRACAAWIRQACSDYRLQPDTGYLAVKYYDAFVQAYRQQLNLSVAAMPFEQLVKHVAAAALASTRTRRSLNEHKESQVCELVLLVCIGVAAKKNESREKALFLGDFNQNFTFEELQAMEHHVLKTLGWNLHYCTPYNFIYYWLGAEKLHDTERKKTNKLCVEAIFNCGIDNEFAGPLSSSIFGSAAMLWAYRVHEKCTKKLEQQMSSHMGGCMEELLATVKRISSHLHSTYPLLRECEGGAHPR